jgi:hypothetical protein
VLISRALAKAQESIEIQDRRFIALPSLPREISGRNPDMHRSREIRGRPPCGIAEFEINEQKGRYMVLSIAKP